MKGLTEERLSNPSGQGAAAKTVHLYGETLQRSHEGFDGRDRYFTSA
jgi:hypothetical protein